jgi:hypothetical protein
MKGENTMRALKELKHRMMTEIDDMNQKSDLSPNDLESLSYAVDIVKDVCEIMDDDGYSRRMSYDYDNGSSYRRGRDRETGRYVSRDGSYDNMMSRLESMRSNAMDENERRMIDRWMNEVERH